MSGSLVALLTVLAASTQHAVVGVEASPDRDVAPLVTEDDGSWWNLRGKVISPPDESSSTVGVGCRGRRRLAVGTAAFKSSVVSDLPNFSHAGYRGDALALPPPANNQGTNVVDVTHHRAIPDDDGDDSSNVIAAVAAAKALSSGQGSGAVVYFPPGLYRIEQDLTFDLTGNTGIVFKGTVNSEGKPQSTLFFPAKSKNGTPWVQYRGKTFITIKGNGFTGASGGPVDVVDGGARMNEFSLTVSGQPAWATAGELVQIIRKIDGVARQDGALDYLGRVTSSQWTKFINSGRGPREFHLIDSIETASGGNTKLTFREPFKTNINPEGSVSWTVEPWKGIAQGVGIEDLVFKGNFQRDSASNCRFHSSSSQAGSMDAQGTWVNGKYDADLWCDGGPPKGKRCDGEFRHHCNYIHDTGYPALSMFRVADSYVRNCIFEDVTNAISLSSAFATTVLDVKVTASTPLGEIEPQMHTSVRVENGNDVFFGRVSMDVSSDHGLGMAGVASGIVFWKCSWPSVTGPEFHSKGLASQNLYDDCSGGMSSVNKGGSMSALGVGGAKGDLPHHGSGLWFWNMEVRLPSGEGDQAFANDFGSERGDHFWADDPSSYGPFVHGVNFLGRHPESSSGRSFIEGGGIHRGQIGLDLKFGQVLSGLEASLYEAQRRLRDTAGAGWVFHPGLKCAVSRSYEETGGWGATNTLAKATANCAADPSCTAIYDYKCDSNGFVLCGRDSGDGGGTGDGGFLVLEPPPSSGGCSYSDPSKARFVLSKRSGEKCVRSRGYGTPGGLDYSSLNTPEKAFAECRSDPKCGGVYDDGNGFMLCDVDGSDGRPILEAAPAAGGCTYLHPERKYTQRDGKTCGSPRDYGSEGGHDYHSLKFIDQAIARCDEDPTCGGLYDYKCDGSGYKLCDRDGAVIDGLAESSIENPPSAGGCSYRREY